MAKLVDVYRSEKQPPLSGRQLPLVVDGTLTMVMDLNGLGLMSDGPLMRGKVLEEFVRKYSVLTSDSELKSAFQVPCKDLLGILSQTVPCVGCRRSVERLFYQLMKSGHRALEPLLVTADGVLSIRDEQLFSPEYVCTLFHGHSARLNSLVESQPRSKKSHRCNLHSLDSQRSRPATGAWRDVWDCMRPQCKEEVVMIESSALLTTLENYLRKHRFCGECRTKVLRAYTLLVEEPDPCKEKGYVPALYAGIRRCLPEKHLHLEARTDYIEKLISKAEPELLGSRRERHAKTMEIAQEEVLTCLGLCMHERLHRINLRLREEESTCRVLAAVAVEALCTNFEMTIELKQGVSQLELLYEQITKEELAKQQRKEQKKLKRKKKKEKKAELEEKENNCECESEESPDQLSEDQFKSCSCSDTKPTMQNTERQKLQVLDRKSKGSPTCYCVDCQRRKREKCSDLSSMTVGPASSVSEHSSSKQISKKGAVNSKKCGLGDSPTINNNVVARGRDSCPSPETSHQSMSMSPCQSCKSAQDLAETSKNTLLNGNGTLKNGNLKNGLHHHWCSHEHSQDWGYSSENNNGCCETLSVSSSAPTSPDGSEVACSDGFCNHEGDCHIEQNGDLHGCERGQLGKVDKSVHHGRSALSLTLEEMLDKSCSSDDDGEESYIPAEEVQAFKSKMRSVTEQRMELRQTLKKRFHELCVNPLQSITPRHAHCASN